MYSFKYSSNSSLDIDLCSLYLKSSTSLKNALSDCVSIAVCHARMQYEDKMLVSLERGIEKLGEKLDVLATFHIRETTP